MKFLVPVITIFLMSLVIVSLVEGQTQEKSTSVLYAQTIVRDAEGNLVAYLETTRMNFVDFEQVDRLINDKATKIINSKVIEEDGTVIEIMSFERKPPSYDTEGTRGLTILGDVVLGMKGVNVAAWFQNEGYFLESDDKLTLVWTVIRTLE